MSEEYHRTEDKASESERNGWVMAPLKMLMNPDIKPSGKILLLLLISRCNSRRDREYRCWPCNRTLAKDMSMSIRSMCELLNHLEKLGIIGRENRVSDGGGRRYVVLNAEAIGLEQITASPKQYSPKAPPKIEPHPRPHGKEEYAEYLQSKQWAAHRSDALKRAGYRCQVCNGKDKLEVHHRTYERAGNEHPADLTVLCDGCHELFHKRNVVQAPKEPIREVQVKLIPMQDHPEFPLFRKWLDHQEVLQVERINRRAKAKAKRADQKRREESRASVVVIRRKHHPPTDGR